jgi:orotate phosphoribosyltransferase
MALSAHKVTLIRLLHEAGALQFGSFTLKSGRVSPYFFNARLFNTGASLAELGSHYARAILRAAPRATIVFGPAYAGIPLAVASAVALKHGRKPVGFLFNRKEEKTHGDKGRFVGRTPGRGDRIVLVDDVITDGGTKREAVALLHAAFPATPIDALVIAFDRQERDVDGNNALLRFRESTGIPVFALLTLGDLIAALTHAPGTAAPAALRKLPRISRAQQRALLEYRARYGSAAPAPPPARRGRR